MLARIASETARFSASCANSVGDRVTVPLCVASRYIASRRIHSSTKQNIYSSSYDTFFAPISWISFFFTVCMESSAWIWNSENTTCTPLARMKSICDSLNIWATCSSLFSPPANT